MRSIDFLDPDTLAVIIVDLQRGYCDPTSDAAHRLGWDVSAANQVCHAHTPFLQSLRELLPPDRIIWLRMEEAPETLASNLHYGPHRSEDFVPLCVRGTKGHDYHIVHPKPGEPEFLKLHYSGFSNKQLREYLEGKGIAQLAFTGVVGSRCVNATILAASALGYECVFVKDLISGPKVHQAEMAAHEKLTTYFYALPVESTTLLSELRRKASPHP